MPIRRLEDTFTGTSATIGADELTSTALASVEHVKPHIQPGVLYPAVAGKILNGTSWLSTAPSLSTTVTVIIPSPEVLAFPVSVKRLPLIDILISLDDKSYSIYITTDNGVINKKLILQ